MIRTIHDRAKDSVNEIIEYLTIRKDLRNVWESIDADVRDTIIKVWIGIIVKNFADMARK